MQVLNNVRASMCGYVVAGAAAFGIAIGSASSVLADAPEYSVSILVQEGDPMPDGDGTIGLINDVSVNDNGDWIADVNVSGGSVSRALIKNGQVLVKPGDPIEPDDEVSSVANALKHLNSHGDLAWRPGLDDNHSGMYLNFTPLIIRNDISTSPDFTPGTEYTGIFRGRVTDDQQVMMIATLSDPQLGTIRAIVWLSEDGRGNVAEDVLIKRHDDAPGTEPGVTINLMAGGANDHAISNDGDVLWHTTLNGAPSDTNGALYRNLDLLVRKGDPSPVNSAAYNNVGASAFRVDMNNHGDYLFLSSLEGHAAGANALVRDVGDGHEVVALRGEVAPDLDGVRLIDHFGSGVQPFITDSGDVVWYARFDGDSGTNQGLYFNDHLLLQKGVTTIDGNLLDAVCGTTALSNGITNSLMASPNGQYIILRNRFADGTRAALLIEVEKEDVVPCPADVTGPDDEPDGVVDVFDLLKVISDWGACDDPNDCPADLTGPDDEPDGVVDVFDLLKVISEWGACP